MADNNALKGIGFLAILSLLAMRACKSCDDAARAGGKNIDNFSCNPKRTQVEPPREPHIPPIEQPPPFKPDVGSGKTQLKPNFIDAIPFNKLIELNVFEDLPRIEDRTSFCKELEAKINTKYHELRKSVPDDGILGGRDKKFYDRLYEQYNDVKNKIRTEFYEDDFVHINYLKNSYKKFDSYSNGSSFSLSTMGPFDEGIIPNFLIEPSNKINLNTYYLYTGDKLNKGQQNVLSEITSLRFTSQKRELNNCILIEKSGDDFLIRSLNDELKVANTSSRLNKITNVNSKNILVKGPLPEELVVWLRNNKVKMVADAMKYFDIINLEKQQIKLLTIIPESDEHLIQFYGLGSSQAKEMRSLLEDFTKTRNTEIIRSKEQLKERLWQGNENETPIVIFHNENGNLFDEPLENYHSLNNVITCNSYNLKNSNLSFNSTDFLYIKQTFNALKKTSFHQKLRLDEFYFLFSGNYNREVSRSHNNKVFNFVLVGVGGTGVVTGAIYLGNRQK